MQLPTKTPAYISSKPISIGRHLPLRPLTWTVGLTPAFWLLGLEQFALLCIFILLWFARPVINVRGPVIPAMILWSLVTLSVFYIEQPYRYLSWLKYFLTYSALLSLIIIAQQSQVTLRSLLSLNRALSWVLLVSSIVAILTFAQAIPLAIPSLMSYLVPHTLLQTGLGRAIFLHPLGVEQSFEPIGTYIRPNSLFLFANTFAYTIVALIPFALIMSLLDRKMAYFHLSAVVSAFFALLLTTSRAALAGVAVAVCVSVFKVRSTPMVVSAILIALTIYTVLGGLLWSVHEFQPLIPFLENILYARGDGSISSRSVVYSETLRAILSAPLLLRASELDIDLVSIPAGSHGYWLSLAFRYSIIAPLLMALIIFLVLSSADFAEKYAAKTDRRFLKYVSVALKCSISGALVMWATENADLDALSFATTWCAWLTTWCYIKNEAPKRGAAK